MPRHLKYTDNRLLDMARQFKKEHGCAPRLLEFPSGLQTTIKRRFKSWENYLQKSIGASCAWHAWSDRELLEFGKTFCRDHRRFPLNADLIVNGKNVRNMIVNKFGSANEWLEKAIGTSPRIEILRAIDALTPPGCDQATPREILIEIRKKMEFPTNLLGFNTGILGEDGFILGGRGDRISWWKLTPKGRELLKQFNKI
jgi:hypothetical protein